MILVTALGGDVVVAGDLEGVLYSPTLFGVKGVHVLVVVVRMMPDGSGRLTGGVDEELVLVVGVVLSDPTVG